MRDRRHVAVRWAGFDGRSSAVWLWQKLQWCGLSETGIASVVESHDLRVMRLLRDGCCWQSKTGGAEPPECGVQMGRPWWMVCRWENRLVGMRSTGVACAECGSSHRQRGRSGSISEPCGMVESEGCGNALSQYRTARAQETGLPNSRRRSLTMFCSREKTARWSRSRRAHLVVGSRILGRSHQLMHAAVIRSCAGDLVNCRSGHDVDFALGIPSRVNAAASKPTNHPTLLVTYIAISLSFHCHPSPLSRPTALLQAISRISCSPLKHCIASHQASCILLSLSYPAHHHGPSPENQVPRTNRQQTQHVSRQRRRRQHERRRSQRRRRQRSPDPDDQVAKLHHRQRRCATRSLPPSYAPTITILILTTRPGQHRLQR